jgi:hypothetical protein
MLQLTDSTIEIMLKYLIIIRVDSSKKEHKIIHIDKLKYILLRSFIDAFVVGGISFFSSMIALGYDDILLNIKLAIVSSVITSGLTLFTELKRLKLGDIVKEKK